MTWPERRALVELNKALAPVAALSTSLDDLATLSAKIRKGPEGEMIDTFVENNNVVDILARLLDLHDDKKAERRRDIVLRLFERPYISSRLVTKSTLLSHLTSVIARNPEAGDAARILRLVSHLAERSRDIDFPAPVMAAALTNMLVFTEAVADALFPRVIEGDKFYTSPVDNVFCDCMYGLAGLCANRPTLPPYAAVAGFVPLLRRVLERARDTPPHESAKDGMIDWVTGSLSVLLAVENNSSSAAEDAHALAMSSGFDLVLGTLLFRHMYISLVERCALSLNADETASVFTEPRIEEFCGMFYHFQGEWPDQDTTRLARIIAHVGAAVPELPARLVYDENVKLLNLWDARNFVVSLHEETEADISDTRTNEIRLYPNVTKIFDALLSTAADRIKMATYMFKFNVHVYCLRVLERALWNPRGYIRHIHHNNPLMTDSAVASSLRTLRLLTEINATSPITGHAESPTAHTFSTDFFSRNGECFLDALRYTDYMQRDGPALQELAQLRALLERLNMVAPTPTATEDAIAQREQASSAVRAFAESCECGEQRAFDGVVARALESCDFPYRVIPRLNNRLYYSQMQFQKPTRDAPGPSDAALALLRLKARASIRARASAVIVESKLRSDLVMSARLYNAQTEQCDTYTMTLAVDDEKYPSHAAYFRVAAQEGALGYRLHGCFGARDGNSPFIALYRHQRALNCPPKTPVMPETDCVYGEYTAPTADTAKTVTYPGGTVLMYPRAALPEQRRRPAVDSYGDLCQNLGTCDTPWFIVFKPCDASVLRGAVPVGRVVSCTTGFASGQNYLPASPSANNSDDEYDEHDLFNATLSRSTFQTSLVKQGGCESIDADDVQAAVSRIHERGPFDEVVLRCFETHCRLTNCNNVNQRSFIALAIDSPENRRALEQL